MTREQVRNKINKTKGEWQTQCRSHHKQHNQTGRGDHCNDQQKHIGVEDTDDPTDLK